MVGRGKQMLETGGAHRTRLELRVLVMGADRATEHALLQRLESMLARVPDAPVVRVSSDLSGCDVLVAMADSAMARVGLHMAQGRDSLPFWLLESDGSLRDGRGPQNGVLDSADITSILLRRCSGSSASVASGPSGSPPAAVLAERLRARVIAHDGVAVMVEGEQRVVWLDFARQLVLPVDVLGYEETIDRLAAAFLQLSVLPTTHRVFDEALSAGVAWPLAPFLWSLGLRIGGGAGLLAPMDGASQLSLRQWPDFRALARRHDHFRLCCLLLKQPSTARQAAALLDLEEAVVEGFFNAAFLSGYADVSAVQGAKGTPEPAAAQVRAGGGSALARMWSSVRRRITASL